MELTNVQKVWLSYAIDESFVLGLEMDLSRGTASLTLDLWALGENGEWPSDAHVVFIFSPVGRVVASLRMGIWNDVAARVVPFDISELSSVVASFGGREIYGGKFFDLHEAEQTKWGDRLSFDFVSSNGGNSHSILLFQEGHGDRHLDLCLWFDDFVIWDAAGQQLTIDEVVAGYRRWSEAMVRGERAAMTKPGTGTTIVPGKRPS